jgi:hypothetical protein
MKYQSLIGEYVLCLKTIKHKNLNINILTNGNKYLIKSIDDYNLEFEYEIGKFTWCNLHYFDLDNHLRCKKIKELLK